ncbi:DUF3530 family protein [Lacimicrobium alkaliphilum]|uniref:DUF3530 domain-containing protein n=1 Tax=Lacimicrobium alkaliphilum TaxID=1526571 RepID=A0A0U3AX04_9ALTE|nr:DUF3530 family protein [Lacimicrobium alkaliphilum]ALS97496.1 hypothetical protein AT746_03895 [Lacimicrobium alkaliphilum]
MIKRCILLLFFSLTCQAEQLIPGEMINQDLERALPEYQYRQLEAGEQRFSVLFNEHTIANNMGVAILINDFGMPHLGPQSLGPLAGYLNNEGWVTLVMTAPDVDFHPLQNTGAEQQDPPAESTKPSEPAVRLSAEQLEQFETLLSERIAAATEFAQSYPGFVLLVAQGISAAALLDSYAEQQQGLPDALVTVSPYWPDPQRNHQLAQKMASLTMPVLDIYNRWNNAWTLSKRQQRLIAAQKALKLHYRQREIIGTDLIAGQYPYLAREVQGWLIHMGW